MSTRDRATSPSLAIETVTPSTIIAELAALVEVAARDLVGRGRELTAAEICGFGGTDRGHDQDSLQPRICGTLSGRGVLAPNDELKTKIHFIHDDLVAKGAGRLVLDPARVGMTAGSSPACP